MSTPLVVPPTASPPSAASRLLGKLIPVASSHALVERARSGDRRAFDALWQRHAGLAYGILLSMLPATEAEDQLQEVALAAWLALDSLQDVQRFAPWLATIARNKGRNALHRHGTRRLQAVGDAQEVPAPRRGDPLEADEILAAIRALPECYREPLVLRLVQGMSGPDIAAHTGLTTGSVRVNLHRGMRLLRQRLEELGIAPD